VAASGRASTAVAAGILLSRLAGLVREKVLAYFLGAGFAAEAFRAALRIPNLLQNLLGDGVLSASFVPTYARALHDGREEEAGALAGAVASILLLVTGSLVAVGVLLAEPLTRLLAPGFPVDSARFLLTVDLVRILTPSLGLLVLSAWALGLLNAHRYFFLAYVAPVLWNAAIVTAVVAAAAKGATEVDLGRALGYGALAGAALQLLVQLPVVLRRSRGLRPGLSFAIPGLRTVLRASGGAIAGRGVVQISAYVDLLLASLLATGAVAALGYAQVLHLLPISLFGMSVAAAALPELAIRSRNDPGVLVPEVRDGSTRVLRAVLPVTVLYLSAPDHVVAALYRGGAFGAAETRQVAAVLAAYALGLAATTQSRLLQSTLYALDDTRTPARLAGLRVLVGSTLGIGAMLLLDGWTIAPGGTPLRLDVGGLLDPALRSGDESLLRLGAVGLALGASVGAWLEWWRLRQVVAKRTGGSIGSLTLGRNVLAAAAVLPGTLLGRAALRTIEEAEVLPGGTLPAALGSGMVLSFAGLAWFVTAVLIDPTGTPGATRIRSAVGLGPRRPDR
jgi:putative peptidoglycan lipid II flippase